MYGYLQFAFLQPDLKLYREYRKYYCGSCAALKHHFGLLATAIVSYDLSVVPMVLLGTEKCCQRCAACYLRRLQAPEDFHTEEWKKVAAVNLAIAYAHIQDGLMDGDSFKHHAANLFLKGKFKKAERAYPAMFEAARAGMQRIREVETRGGNLHDQSMAFAEMVVSILQHVRPLEEDEEMFFSALARWFCMADALDDYPKDRKKHVYNPFLVEQDAVFDDFVSANYAEICTEYADIHKTLALSIRRMEGVPTELLRGLVFRVIPEGTHRLLQGRFHDKWQAGCKEVITDLPETMRYLRRLR